MFRDNRISSDFDFCSGEIERHLQLSETLLQGYRYIKSGLPRTPLRN